MRSATLLGRWRPIAASNLRIDCRSARCRRRVDRSHPRASLSGGSRSPCDRQPLSVPGRGAESASSPLPVGRSWCASMPTASSRPTTFELAWLRLHVSNAAMVGGAMVPVGDEATRVRSRPRCRSKLGAGPACSTPVANAGWVDTVYFGAFRHRAPARSAGMTRTSRPTRTPSSQSAWQGTGNLVLSLIYAHYSPRSSVPEVARQFYRYGLGRAATIRRHPSSVKGGQFVVAGTRARTPFALAAPGGTRLRRRARRRAQSRRAEKGWGR